MEDIEINYIRQTISLYVEPWYYEKYEAEVVMMDYLNKIFYDYYLCGVTYDDVRGCWTSFYTFFD